MQGSMVSDVGQQARPNFQELENSRPTLSAPPAQQQERVAVPGNRQAFGPMPTPRQVQPQRVFQQQRQPHPQSFAPTMANGVQVNAETLRLATLAWNQGALYLPQILQHPQFQQQAFNVVMQQIKLIRRWTGSQLIEGRRESVESNNPQENARENVQPGEALNLGTEQNPIILD